MAAGRKRAPPHPQAQMRKRMRQAHERGIQERRRQMAAALLSTILPLSLLSVLQTHAVGPGTAPPRTAGVG